MLRLERRYLAHDRNGALVAHHVLDVVAQVAPHRLQPVLAFADRALHCFAPDVGGAYIAEVDEFLLVANVVIKSGVGQAEQVGDVLERGAAVALDVETARSRLEHAVLFEAEARIDGIFGPGPG